MSLNESDTRAKLIDPAIHSRGWTEDLIRREETAGAIEEELDAINKLPAALLRRAFSGEL
jgi:type I site-specific restriction endonuclease